MTEPRRIAVVGGGLAGLTAAYDLAALGHDVVVLEESQELGGKLRRRAVAGVGVDVGAEAMLTRQPEGMELLEHLGLAVEHPTATTSMIWVDDQMRPMPRSMMGVPLDLAALADSGVLTGEGLNRARQEPSIPIQQFDRDISVGDLVSQRFGDEVTDRLVEPLLGGVYAGRAREISAQAAMPKLFGLAQRGSLLEQASSLAPSYELPLFAAIPGGMASLPEALVAGGSFRVRTGTSVRSLRRAVPGFALTVGTAMRPEVIEVDGVVLATPAAPTTRLLSDVAPRASGEIAAIEYASVAVVTLAFRSKDLPELGMIASSGFLVPPIEGRTIKACTFSFAKWAWVREAGRRALEDDSLLFLRTSIGRFGDDIALQASYEELVSLTLEDLADMLGLTATPLDAQVERWPDALPQYAVGHLDRMARIRRAIEEVPGLEVCGAAYDGVGIPAVIASAHRAAAQLFGSRGRMNP